MDYNIICGWLTNTVKDYTGHYFLNNVTVCI